MFFVKRDTNFAMPIQKKPEITHMGVTNFTPMTALRINCYRRAAIILMCGDICKKKNDVQCVLLSLLWLEYGAHNIYEMFLYIYHYFSLTY
jgi:hypothetical protein